MQPCCDSIELVLRGLSGVLKKLLEVSVGRISGISRHVKALKEVYGVCRVSGGLMIV